MKNQMCIEFDSKSENEAFARVVAASFAAQANPTLEEIDDIKTVVSEAVTNAIIHGYQECDSKKIFMECRLEGREFYIAISDRGVGIEDIEQARRPMFTTKPDIHRAGMGFTFMETLMDKLEVYSKLGEGTTIKMIKIMEGK